MSVDVNLESLLNSEYLNVIHFPGLRQFTFNIEDFDLLETIGYGNYQVKGYLHKPSKKRLAIKFIPIMSSRFMSMDKDESIKYARKLLDEVKLHRELALSTHVVEFYGFGINDHHLLHCMEWMNLPLDDLSSLVHEHQKYFSEQFLGYITVNIIQALNECKLRNVIHRDLKPQNIMINWSGEIKLIDFGVSRYLNASKADSYVGTVLYWPPERFMANYDSSVNQDYDVQADVWALGITLLELISGHAPYFKTYGSKNVIGLQYIISNLREDKIHQLIEECFQSNTDFTYSPHLKEFIGLCLKEYSSRPKYDELKKTKFFEYYSSVERDSIIKELSKLKKVFST